MTIGRKTGGRKPGTKNRVIENTRRDILAVYRQLGGRKWLLTWAKENGTEFVGKVLARVMPPMPRDDPDPTAPTSSAPLSEFDAAMRIAFVLSKAAHLAGLEQAPLVVHDQPAIEAVPETLPALDEAPIQPLGDGYHTLESTVETQAETIHRGSAAEQGRPAAGRSRHPSRPVR